MKNAPTDAKRSSHLQVVKSTRTFTLPHPPPEVSLTLAKLRASFFLVTDLLGVEAQWQDIAKPDARLKNILDGLRSLPRNDK